jgi:hypothetical protein
VALDGVLTSKRQASRVARVIDVAFVRQLLADVGRIGRFVPVASYQRLAYCCGALLLLSGVVHLGVYAVDGGPWGGPLSWRKPIVFGLSFGITLVTLTWIMGLLRPGRRAASLVLGILSISAVGEVALISMQTWRGVASHFNEATPFDGLVFSLMGLLVAVVVLMVVTVTVWSMVRISAPPSLALAVRAGLVLMLVSQAVGVQMILEGGNTFGTAGALKLPHAVTLHAVQVLPAVALLLLASDTVERYRVRVVGLGTAGYAFLIAATMAQTYGGRAPLTASVVPTMLALCGLVLLAVSVLVAFRGLRPRMHPPAAPAVGA